MTYKDFGSNRQGDLPTEHTNATGTRFYVEPAMDFDRSGNMFDTGEVFAGVISGDDHLKGVWFKTRDAALSALQSWEG